VGRFHPQLHRNKTIRSWHVIGHVNRAEASAMMDVTDVSRETLRHNHCQVKFAVFGVL